jgi:multidrug resistance efflux pump
LPSGIVTGGQVMSTDDAYGEADKVGVSTDVSGIVQQIDVTENQRVDAGQVLYRLDDLPFRLALQRAEAQVGIVRNDLNALKANYGDMQGADQTGAIRHRLLSSVRATSTLPLEPASTTTPSPFA